MKYNYWSFLKHHIIIKSIPSVILFVILITTIYNVVQQVILLYKDIEQQDISMLSVTFLVYALTKLLKYGVSAIVVSIVFAICTSGLYFLPYLATRQSFNIFSTIKYGLKKLFRVLVIIVPINLCIALMLFIFTFIPILNVLVPLLTPFFAAIFTVYYDYLFSINAKHGLPLHSHWASHFKDLYFSKNSFILYSIVLAFLYSTVIGAFLFRPYIQYKMTLHLTPFDAGPISKMDQYSSLSQ